MGKPRARKIGCSPRANYRRDNTASARIVLRQLLYARFNLNDQLSEDIGGRWHFGIAQGY